jgi:mannose/fructose/N-acetylgalactosamine-specific phosphotransferase system component IID
MVASMVTVKLGWTIGSGDGAIDLNSVLDGIMPKMLPLAVTFALSKALGKGAKVNTLLLVIVVLSIAAAWCGLLTA